MTERKFTRPSEAQNRHMTYNETIDRAKAARNTQKNDSNPYMEMEGILGIDDIDKMRRRKIR